MKDVTGAQDFVDSLLSAGDKLVIVIFFSPGCGGCKALHPKVFPHSLVSWRIYVPCFPASEVCLCYTDVPIC